MCEYPQFLGETTRKIEQESENLTYEHLNVQCNMLL